MKKYFILALLLLPVASFSQDCAEELKGTFTVAWGMDSKQAKYASFEAGIWKGKLSLDLGLSAWARPEDTTGYHSPYYAPTAQTFANVYLKAGFMLYRSETGSFIDVVSVSTHPQISNSFYLQPSSSFLIGVSPFYSFQNKSAGVWLSVRLGMN